MSEQSITLQVNGAEVQAQAEPRQTLLDFLRDTLGLKGAHAGCEHGVCGACTVMAQGHTVRTIEGLRDDAGDIGPVQDAFWECHAMQCGYCTPAMILTAHALLERNPDPGEAEIREALSGNLCRCTGYVQIVEAVQRAAAVLRQQP
jgi:carbon-monoxide dehydrogenase small subunit